MYADAAAIKGRMNLSSFPDIFLVVEPRMSWSHKCKSPWYPALTWARVKSHKEQDFVWKKIKAAASPFNAIEWQFLFCSLPKPCAACHTGKVGSMELRSRSKRRSQMPMCPPDISTGTPCKKMGRFQFESDPAKKSAETWTAKKNMCSVVWLDIGGMAVAFPFAISLVRHLVYQRLLGTNHKSIRNMKRSWKFAPPGSNFCTFLTLYLYLRLLVAENGGHQFAVHKPLRK